MTKNVHRAISETRNESRLDTHNSNLQSIWQLWLKSIVVTLLFTSSVVIIIGTLIVSTTSVKQRGSYTDFGS